LEGGAEKWSYQNAARYGGVLVWTKSIKKKSRGKLTLL